MSKTLLTLDNVSIGYGQTVVVPGITLDITSDCFIGVIGPNGGGKTTMIKTIIGMIPPLCGKVKHHHKPLRMGYMPQINTLDRQFPISVFETVLSGLVSQKRLFGKYGKADKDKVYAILERAHASDLADKSVAELSGGELQKVLLCRAIISDPHILLLDEPTTYIDGRFEQEFYSLLTDLNRDMAVVVISHDLSSISGLVKSFACVNHAFHYHASNHITQKHLEQYDCPVKMMESEVLI